MRNMLQYYSQKYNMAGQTSSFRTLQKIGENLTKKRELYSKSEQTKASSKYTSNRKLHSSNTSQLSFITLDNSILNESQKPSEREKLEPRVRRISEKKKRIEENSKAI